jgi:hypothetical protein
MRSKNRFLLQGLERRKYSFLSSLPFSFMLFLGVIFLDPWPLKILAVLLLIPNIAWIRRADYVEVDETFLRIRTTFRKDIPLRNVQAVGPLVERNTGLWSLLQRTPSSRNSGLVQLNLAHRTWVLLPPLPLPLPLKSIGLGFKPGVEVEFLQTIRERLTH